MNLINVPLSKLELSPLNVRKTRTGDIAELAASIHAHGLLQNLTVIARDERFEVVAGSQRLRALQDLRARDLIHTDYEVPCSLVDAEGAHEASLTENVTRSAMHPADEFDAFYQLREDGRTVADIAARFGRTERYVEQRLRLALLSPTVLKAYRDGTATLDQMMALAVTDDQARQLRVWKAARSDWQRDPRYLRQALVDGECEVTSRIGQFVGVAAYEKAGGVVRRDLFGTDEDSTLVDVEIVQRLALEKLERTAEKIRKEGWKWVEARIAFGYEESNKFGMIYPTRKGTKEVWSDEQKQNAGVVVTIAHNGHTEIQRGLVRPGDAKSVHVHAHNRAKAGTRKPGDLSFSAVQRLQAEGGQIVALAISQNHEIALRLLTAELADDAFYQGWGGARTWVHVQREHAGRMPGNVRKEIGQTLAAVEFVDAEKRWRERLPKKRGELRTWILAQDFPTIQQLLAFLVARETEVVDQSAGAKDGVVELASAVGVNLGEHWRPTAEWLATLPKSTVIAMADDAGIDAVTVAQTAKLPKVKFAEQAAAAFPAGWLPKPLRPAAATKAKASKASKSKKAMEAKAAPTSDPKFPWDIKQDGEARA